MNKILDKLDKLFLRKTFGAYYNKGLEYYEKKNYEKAIEFFEIAMNMPNFKPQVYYNLGLAYQKSNKFVDAIVYYQTFLNYEPSDYDATYNLGLAYYYNFNFSKAIEMFKHCLKIKKDTDNYKALTLSYIENNQIDKALETSMELFENYEQNRELFFIVAKSIESKNKFNKNYALIDKAIELYSKMLEKNDRDIEAYLAISICYAKKANWDLSVKNCLAALEIDPNSYDGNNQMGLIYYCNEKLNDAIIYYKEALKTKETSKAYLNLAYAYERAKKTKLAKETFKLLLKKYPEIKSKEEIKKRIRILTNNY